MNGRRLSVNNKLLAFGKCFEMQFAETNSRPVRSILKLGLFTLFFIVGQFAIKPI